jgi:hypothetical protein
VRKSIFFVPKCDSLEKHVREKINEYGQKVMDMKYAHVKNEVQYVAMKHVYVID